MKIEKKAFFTKVVETRQIYPLCLKIELVRASESYLPNFSHGSLEEISLTQFYKELNGVSFERLKF